MFDIFRPQVLVANFWEAIKDFLIAPVFAFIPTWAFVVAGGVLLGWLYKKVGWQGVVGGAIALLTFGAYRQGWNDATGRKKPVVPINPDPVVHAPSPKRKNTVQDWLRGIRDGNDNR